MATGNMHNKHSKVCSGKHSQQNQKQIAGEKGLTKALGVICFVPLPRPPGPQPSSFAHLGWRPRNDHSGNTQTAIQFGITFQIQFFCTHVISKMKKFVPIIKMSWAGF